ncbi:endopeptidase La [Oleiagrimonas soli]|uniref:Lon protease n=1 Tax=Oleiagrimonas soli TaxID=1543381 RepID=A0A099CUJ8_9GAMM|nr:endopeptidase La [Oleiagrimonas soli]KGI77598.1 DNA-binding protein [Oleiagrimonas soli]MBB6182911.1 ATP-dependent Lon protease [Oleiagrimonas soli]
MTQAAKSSAEQKFESVPVLPLRDVVVYPHMVIPLFVGREKSMRALEAAMDGERQILLVAQTGADIDDPVPDDLYQIGTLANVLQLLRLPDGTVKVLVEGQSRVVVDDYQDADDLLRAHAHVIESVYDEGERELEVVSRTLVSLFEQLVKQSRKLPPEVLSTLSGIEDPSRLADTIAAHLSVRIADKQKVLETVEVGARLEQLVGLVDGEMDLQQVEKRIRGRIKSQMEKSQREYYLNEQMKAIQKELGEGEDGTNEVEALQKKIDAAGMPKEVLAKARQELNKLKQMSPMSAEATVVRNYLDWLVATPWKKRSKVRKDLQLAKEVLDADHFGLEEVKERILEYLAVQQRVNNMKGPILCLVGPPGVGKTSLGKSIAKATNRKFVRNSLGGVRDEAEIRGHRRTYIGSMPGRIVQNLSKVGTRNPLYVLDEIDKMSMDFRGDPSSALLEVLDPEQNHTFNDHYLEVDVDLSEVMWIATANSLNIPGPLLDRMEVIRIPGYTEDEKIAIARRYLLPKQLKANGLKDDELSVSDNALRDIVRYYTRESGVRNLEREISRICRKVVKTLSLEEANKKNARKGKKSKADASETTKTSRKSLKIDSRNLDKYLGVRRYDFGRKEQQNEVGLVTGLAWTQVGGDLLSIEASVVPGKGKLVHTGQLGDVMKESIQAALSVVRARSEMLGIDPDFHSQNDIHVHVPEGATPKDGPSAGIAMCTALVSVLTKVPVRAELAMTGEITLRGRVLPIGGLKEKLLAAHRGGITTVIIPEENRKDLTDIPSNITDSLDIHPVRWIDEVLDLALERPLGPKAKSGSGKERGAVKPAKKSANRPAPPRTH